MVAREAFAGWRKSSRSKDSNECVEVGTGAPGVGVRDSRLHGHGPVLVFSATAWRAFTQAVKDGGHELS